MKKQIAVSVISTVLVLLSLYVVNAVIMQQQKNKLSDISATLLHYSEDLTQTVAAVLKGANRQGCDNDSLESYRKMKLNSVWFSDVGFIEKGKIICTAFWGKLAHPVPLTGELHSTPNGFLLAQLSQKNFFTGNAVIYRNLIIFTSRYAYDKFIPVTANYSLSTMTRDFGRTFFSVSPDNYKRSWLHADAFTLTLTRCSARWDLCAMVKQYDAGLATLSVMFFMLLTGVLYLIWVPLSLFCLRLYEDRFSLERALVKAVKANAIGVHYQPIIRIHDQKIAGVEVLSRWQDANHTEVSPELFIPLIEKLGLYERYYANTISKSLAEIAPLALAHQLIISLNVGHSEIEGGRFIDVLQRACRQNGIPLTLIKIELSEKAIAREGILAEFCKSLKDIGVRVSIDDFGVQNSNIARLANLPYDEIKIDKSLVDGINECYKKEIFIIFCDALLKLNKTLVFEGVENETQYQFIAQRYSNALIQGWYFSKALSYEALAKKLNTPGEEATQ